MADLYEQLFRKLDALCEGEQDEIALMATIACELYETFDRFDWVGFYRNVGNDVLKIGPYQGSHGCLEIPFNRGVCGKCASERKIQNVHDVSQIEHHIACSSSTKSEIVVPILGGKGELIAVLDIDSNTEDAFDENDERQLARLGSFFA